MVLCHDGSMIRVRRTLFVVRQDTTMRFHRVSPTIIRIEKHFLPKIAKLNLQSGALSGNGRFKWSYKLSSFRWWSSKWWWSSSFSGNSVYLELHSTSFKTLTNLTSCKPFKKKPRKFWCEQKLANLCFINKFSRSLQKDRFKKDYNLRVMAVMKSHLFQTACLQEVFGKNIFCFNN